MCVRGEMIEGLNSRHAPSISTFLSLLGPARIKYTRAHTTTAFQANTTNMTTEAEKAREQVSTLSLSWHLRERCIVLNDWRRVQIEAQLALAEQGSPDLTSISWNGACSTSSAVVMLRQDVLIYGPRLLCIPGAGPVLTEADFARLCQALSTHAGTPLARISSR